MYHRYESRACVVSRTPRGEGDAIYVLFVEHIGKLQAVATGVRKQQSKLGPSLQVGNLCNISLVRGKEVWRIIDAQVVCKPSKEALKILARIFALLLKHVEKEEALQHVFDDLITFYNLSHVSFNEELWLVGRLLRSLGYVRQVKEVERFLDTLTPGILSEQEKVTLKQAIEHSLKHMPL